MRTKNKQYSKKATNYENSSFQYLDDVPLLHNCIDYPTSTLKFLLQFFPTININQMQNTKHISFNTAEIYIPTQHQTTSVDATTLTINFSTGKSLAVNVTAIPSESMGFIFAVASLFTSTTPISK